MTPGSTYKVTLDDDTIIVGKYTHAWSSVDGDGITIKINDGAPGAMIWYDEIETIERLGYVRKTINKSVSKIGTPHG